MNFLSKLEDTLRKRKQELPENSYTSNLFKEGLDRILKKVGEEASEVIIASKNNDKSEFIHEVADLLFHVEVLLVQKGYSLKDVVDELERRHS